MNSTSASEPAIGLSMYNGSPASITGMACRLGPAIDTLEHDGIHFFA